MALRQLWNVFQDALSSAWCFFRHPFKVKNSASSEVEAPGRGCICHRFSRVLPSKRVVFSAVSEVYAILLVWVARIKDPDHASVKSLSDLNFINGYSRALKLNDCAVWHHSIGSMCFPVFVHENFKGCTKVLEVLLPANMPSRWALSPRIAINP